MGAGKGKFYACCLFCSFAEAAAAAGLKRAAIGSKRVYLKGYSSYAAAAPPFRQRAVEQGCKGVLCVELSMRPWQQSYQGDKKAGRPRG